MGIVEESVRKASIAMSHYGIPEEEQIAIVKLLLDAGIEKCLDEQQRLRDEKDALIMKAFSQGLVH